VDVTRRIRYDAWAPGARSDHGAGPDAPEWTSPWCDVGFGFTELVPSWSATTPPGTWIEIRVTGADERPHPIALWTSQDDATHRTSLSGDPEVDTDVWRPTAGSDRYRLSVTRHHDEGRPAPVLHHVGAVVSAGNVPSTTSSPSDRTAPVLDVPRLSQMTWQEVGGRGWCSPAAVAMVLAHAGRLPPGADVPAVARHVFDPAYDGTGNWPFNTAWAAGLADHGFVTRLHDLREAAAFVAAGIPLVASVAYPAGALPGAPTHATDGHLIVIRGFTGPGDVVTNDPAAPSERSVRRTYGRAAFERAWLEGSGGLVYVIHRDDQPLPPRGRAGAW
jgi:Peptidase_C39 like family